MPEFQGNTPCCGGGVIVHVVKHYETRESMRPVLWWGCACDALRVKPLRALLLVLRLTLWVRMSWCYDTRAM
jgi:hypothetical protein